MIPLLVLIIVMAVVQLAYSGNKGLDPFKPVGENAKHIKEQKTAYNTMQDEFKNYQRAKLDLSLYENKGWTSDQEKIDLETKVENLKQKFDSARTKFEQKQNEAKGYIKTNVYTDLSGKKHTVVLNAAQTNLTDVPPLKPLHAEAQIAGALTGMQLITAQDAENKRKAEELQQQLNFDSDDLSEDANDEAAEYQSSERDDSSVDKDANDEAEEELRQQLSSDSDEYLSADEDQKKLQAEIDAVEELKRDMEKGK